MKIFTNRRSFPTPFPLEIDGQQYLSSVPEQVDPNYIWANNRDTLEGNWQKIGDPITERAVGRTAFRNFQNKDENFFTQAHHGSNMPAESFMSDRSLKARLDAWGLPNDGNRDDNFRRIIETKSNPDLMEQAMANQQRDPYGVRAAMQRNAASTMAPPPMETPQRTGQGFGGDAMTISSLNSGISTTPKTEPFSGIGRTLGTGASVAPQAASAATEAGAASGGMSGLSSGLGMVGSFAARANPVLAAALMGYQLYNMMDASNKAKQQEKDMKNARV